MTTRDEHNEGCAGEQWEDTGTLPIGVVMQRCTGCGAQRSVAQEPGKESRDITTVAGLAGALADYARRRSELVMDLVRRGAPTAPARPASRS